jgi:two-component system cell cycle response regulator
MTFSRPTLMFSPDPPICVSGGSALTTTTGDHAIEPTVLAASAGPMRVLAAEDNPVFQSMLKTMLTKWGYRAVIARNGTEAWRVLDSEDAPRLAVLDWMMPGMDGVEICRRIRSANREPYIYILLLTARTESRDLIEGMDAGADDYLTKPFNSHELRVRLNAGRRILDLQEELLRAREALREQATHDGLTGLLNRTSILEKLDDELARAARAGTPVSVLMADLDRFKSINDTYGHLVGDAVLREAACRLKSAARRYDSVGRYGGEEFLIVLPGCDAAHAAVQAERMRDALGATPFLSASQPVLVTVSLGAACSAHCAPETLVREADDALYEAKAEGRNRVVLHSVGLGLAGYSLP